jgi:hypothetical protein
MLSILPVLLEIIIIMMLTSTILLPYNNTIAQTLDTITKQMEIFKNNPQIPVMMITIFMTIKFRPRVYEIHNKRSNKVSGY